MVGVLVGSLVCITNGGRGGDGGKGGDGAEGEPGGDGGNGADGGNAGNILVVLGSQGGRPYSFQGAPSAALPGAAGPVVRPAATASRASWAGMASSRSGSWVEVLG